MRAVRCPVSSAAFRRSRKPGVRLPRELRIGEDAGLVGGPDRITLLSSRGFRRWRRPYGCWASDHPRRTCHFEGCRNSNRRLNRLETAESARGESLRREVAAAERRERHEEEVDGVVEVGRRGACERPGRATSRPKLRAHALAGPRPSGLTGHTAEQAQRDQLGTGFQPRPSAQPREKSEALPCETTRSIPLGSTSPRATRVERRCYSPRHLGRSGARDQTGASCARECARSRPCCACVSRAVPRRTRLRPDRPRRSRLLAQAPWIARWRGPGIPCGDEGEEREREERSGGAEARARLRGSRSQRRPVAMPSSRAAASARRARPARRRGRRNAVQCGGAREGERRSPRPAHERAPRRPAHEEPRRHREHQPPRGGDPSHERARQVRPGEAGGELRPERVAARLHLERQQHETRGVRRKALSSRRLDRALEQGVAVARVREACTRFEVNGAVHDDSGQEVREARRMGEHAPCGDGVAPRRGIEEGLGPARLLKRGSSSRPGSCAAGCIWEPSPARHMVLARGVLS